MQFYLSLQELPKILQWIKAQLKPIGFDAARLRRVELASEEVLVNILSHAYKEKPGNVEIEVNHFPHIRAEVIFSDTGPPFNPLKVAPVDTNLPLEKRKVGGLGIHFIRNLVDEITYTYVDGKNVLKLAIPIPSS